MFAQLIKTRPDFVPLLKRGEVIEVVVMEKTPRAVYFEVPRIGTGVVYGRELLNARNVVKNLAIADRIHAKIVEVQNEDGFIELSLTEADKQKSWQAVKELEEKGESVVVKIAGANSGGLVADLHELKAFIPVSQLSPEHYPHVPDQSRDKILEALQKFVGVELTVKIIGLNPRTNKLILSERAASHQNVKELVEQYAVGDVVTGIISGLANFGAFIRFADNPEVEGLIHISELDHRLIDLPKEVVSVGDMVKAQVIEIKDHRISLSLKALKPDPWKNVVELYQPGATVRGTVHKFNPFGAFVQLNEEITGLIHVSEFGGVDVMRKELSLGGAYDFLIDTVRPEEKRIVLKLPKRPDVPAGASEA